jgi:hypothetical protein
MEIFLLYFTPQMLQHVYGESVHYVKQCGDFSFTVTVDEFFNLIALLLWSGCVTLPRTRIYWDMPADLNLPLPATLMTT